MGNLSAATCDTWSNESVQNIKLLGGMAPTCYMEQLIYDCRLMNRARADGKAAASTLQRWFVESDVATDPQAFIISPESAVALGRVIVESDSDYHAGVAVSRKAVSLMRAAHEAGQLHIADNEVGWFDILDDALDDLPADEGEFISRQLAVADPAKFLPAEYGLA
jgi:methanol--5-hydroxybenzimidazolylcobamide Co-methyltransferase